jgi:hypothetical protein
MKQTCPEITSSDYDSKFNASSYTLDRVKPPLSSSLVIPPHYLRRNSHSAQRGQGKTRIPPPPHSRRDDNRRDDEIIVSPLESSQRFGFEDSEISNIIRIQQVVVPTSILVHAK